MRLLIARLPLAHAAIIGLALAGSLGAPPGALAQAPAPAQDVQALRRQLDELRRQMETLTERLRALESRPAAAAPAPATVTPAPPAAAPGTVAVTPAPPAAAERPGPTLAELARPREPFALWERRGPGQLLFDAGIVGDLVASFAQRNADKAQAGTFQGRENRFIPREVEVNLFGRVDPYAEGVVRFEFAEEFEDGERLREAKLAEAHLTLLTLPFGTQLRLGQVPVRFGALSHLHREALPQPDAPNVLTRFLGEEQFREVGAELSWVAPLPVFLEALVGVFNGDNETAFGRGSLRAPLLTGRLRTFLELGEAGGLQVGVSAATGETPERRRNTLWGVDLRYKWTPEGWGHPLLTLGGELLYQDRRVNVAGEDLDGDGLADTPDETRIRERLGWYAYAQVQPWRRWLGGVRYDWTELPAARGREWAVEPYLAFMPSEFLRFRLAWKHTERDKRDAFGDHGGSGRLVDEILLQATFFLGAHAPHPF
jgi:hypothetical protein